MLNQNYTPNQNNKSSQISKSNPRYSHLSEDSIAFLQHCHSTGVNPIQRHIGKSTEYKMRPFQNGNPEKPEYFCVRHLASYSDRNILSNWSLYELKDGGFLIQINDYGPPSVMFYHMLYDNLSEIENSYTAPFELIADAKSALQKMTQDDPERTSMVGIPTQKDERTVAIKPKKKTAKLKTEAELKALSSAMLNKPKSSDSVLNHLKPRGNRWVYEPDYW